MQVAVLGVDLGKNSCSIVGLDDRGAVVVKKRMRRMSVIAFAETIDRCVVAMEACCGAHHMGRELSRLGHEVRLMSPEYVRPYVKAQKNDDRDAEAIAEAATRPTMRFVELKTEEQLDVQTLHRVRDRLVRDRTSLMNQIRSLLLERGHTVPQGRKALRERLGELVAEGADLVSARMRFLLCDMADRIEEVSARIDAFDREFDQMAKTGDRARRLTSIPGIGALNATAFVAAVGDARSFAKGRDLAAWLGLVPKQATTGGTPRLLGITKRGNRYIRKLLIQGARSALPSLLKQPTRLGAWLRRLSARMHVNKVVVALAAKMARIVWALLRHGQTYQAAPAAA